MPETAQYLIRARADVNCADHKGHTPLHCLALRCEAYSAESVRVLLRDGVDVGAKNKKGESAYDLGGEEWKTMVGKTVADHRSILRDMSKNLWKASSWLFKK